MRFGLRPLCFSLGGFRCLLLTDGPEDAHDPVVLGRLFFELLRQCFALLDQILVGLPVCEARTLRQLLFERGSEVVVLLLQRFVLRSKLLRILRGLFASFFGFLSGKLRVALFFGLLGQRLLLAFLHNFSGLPTLSHAACGTDGGQQRRLIHRLAILFDGVRAGQRQACLGSLQHLLDNFCWHFGQRTNGGALGEYLAQ